MRLPLKNYQREAIDAILRRDSPWTVVLPDFQGLGIGNRLSEVCASIWKGLGGRSFSTTSHPAMIRYRSASPRWNRRRLGRVAAQGNTGVLAKSSPNYQSSADRNTAGFQYVGPAMDASLAQRYATSRAAIFDSRPAVKEVLSTIERYAGASTGLIARKTGLTTTTVRNCVAELLADNQISRRGGKGESGPQAFYRS